jgi:pimeloyl-ACP methyl ester carboxylesterase
MKKLSSLKIWIVVLLLVNSSLKGQEAAAPNGKFATVNGVKIYYEETGTGMPLILLHGFTRTASDWKPFLPALSKSYRVIAIDLPGHGRSGYMDTTNVYLHKRAAEYVIALTEQLHLDSVNVIGISSGGFITLYMATLKPQLTRRIIVIGGQVYYSSITRNVITSEGPGTEDPNRLKYATALHGKEKGTLMLRQFWNFRKLYGDPSFTPDVLASIKARALIIHGDDDFIAPVSNAWEMFQHIPGARLWVVPSGGHVPVVIEKNQEDFLRRAIEFLSGGWDKK